MFSKFIYSNLNPILSQYLKFVIKRRSEDLSWQRKLILEKMGVNVILDVGAHFGEFYEEVRRSGYKNRVISIEPTLSSFEILKKIKSNDQSFKSLNIALGEETGELIINEYEESSMNSILDVDRDSTYILSPKKGSSKIGCMTLDELIQSESLENEVIFIKLDVQGFELKILKGLNKYLESVSAMQVEISINPVYRDASNLPEFIEWLEKNNFKIVSIVTERFHESVVYAYDIDILCVRVK